MEISIFYGIKNNYHDITGKIWPFLKNGMLQIQPGDSYRASFFEDPIVGVIKHILVVIDGEEFIFDDKTMVNIDISKFNLNQSEYLKKVKSEIRQLKGLDRLPLIHKSIICLGGSIQLELPEQHMAAMYIEPTDTVLELGSNIGRNTLVISSILDDDRRLVTLETDKNTCSILKKNREINLRNFSIVNAALSKTKLMQKGWDCFPVINNAHEEELRVKGYSPVPVTTFDNLELLFPFNFNVLVADCEGALYYIIQDFPDFFSKFEKIIMENDYHDIYQKKYVDEQLVKNKFKCVYSKGGGWGPCSHNFFEVWAK